MALYSLIIRPNQATTGAAGPSNSADLPQCDFFLLPNFYSPAQNFSKKYQLPKIYGNNVCRICAPSQPRDTATNATANSNRSKS